MMPADELTVAPVQGRPVSDPLRDTCWAEVWRGVQDRLGRDYSPEKWDKRAPSFGSVRGTSPYIEPFVRMLNPRPEDVFFDMGCGNGGVAIPLACAGHRVIARDFSTGMLQALRAGAEGAGVADLIDIGQLSWEDDWAAAGITDGMADIAFASRSIITSDLGAALEKLSRVARRRVYVTLNTGYSPKTSPTILQELGIDLPAAFDYVYAFIILVQMGYAPEVSYIVHDRKLTFANMAEGCEQVAAMLESARDFCDDEHYAAAQAGIPGWVEAHQEVNDFAGQMNYHHEIEAEYGIVIPNDVRWAVIQWEV